MNEKIKLIIGILWASPVTLLSFLFYILPLWALGKYQYVGWDEVAWVWQFDMTNPNNDWLTEFLRKKWRRWAGSTLGTIYVLKHDPLRKLETRQRIMVHEKEHVRQIMKLGVFQPLIYAIIYLVGRFVLKNVNGYYDNIFEIDARRKAGELVDIVGVVNKLKDQGSK